MGDRDDLLIVDWGTSNRRIFVMENGAITAVHRDDRGVATLRDFEQEIATIRSRFGPTTPMLLAGMIGSSIGWKSVPYVSVPVDLHDIADATCRVEPDIYIVPGACDRGAGRLDVMRGEETQILGAVASGFLSDDALVCQPGTHSKWVTIRGGRIASFVTAMTGEMFGLIKHHSILSAAFDDRAWSDDDFRDGVADGAQQDILTSLFQVRARSLLVGADDRRNAQSFVSGLLLGAEVQGRLKASDFSVVHIIADDFLGRIYDQAIRMLGGDTVLIDVDRAFAAGAMALWRRLR